MSLESVLSCLCLYDRRNPDCISLGEPEEESRKPRSNWCSCDNCFYGRDALAMEILLLQEELRVSEELHFI